MKLEHIYRIPMGERNGIRIWLVDGYLIRQHIYPDFGFSGNDLAYHFIPPGEIWIDGQVSCEETEYSIATEMMERELMIQGKSYDDAYEAAITRNKTMRDEMEKLINRQKPIFIQDSLTRDVGKMEPGEI